MHDDKEQLPDKEGLAKLVKMPSRRLPPPMMQEVWWSTSWRMATSTVKENSVRLSMLMPLSTPRCPPEGSRRP